MRTPVLARARTLTLATILAVFAPAGSELGANVCHAASPASSTDTFDEEFWQVQAERGRAKQIRGLGLGLTGLASFALTGYLIKKSVEDPRRYVAAVLLSGISGLGMTIHGFASIAVGRRQRAQAEAFRAAHRTGNTADLGQAEAQHMLEVRRLASTKMTIFGAVLALESAIALSQAIMLSVHRHRGDDLRGARMWPSYLIGGLLLPASTGLIWLQARNLRNLKREQSRLNVEASLRPQFAFDRRAGLQFGLSASGRF